MSYTTRIFSVLAALAGFAAFSHLTADDGRFSLALGSHDDLLISGPGSAAIADVPAQTVGKSLTMGTTTARISFGRDANGQLTAVLAALAQDSAELHFSARGKSIDADKAIVTLTFSPDSKSLVVDPGYVGTVQVDSHLLPARKVADDSPAPAASAPSDVIIPTPPLSGVTETTPSASSEMAPVTPYQSAAPALTPSAPVMESVPAPEIPLTPHDDKPPTPDTNAGPTAQDLHNALTPLASQLTHVLSPH